MKKILIIEDEHYIRQTIRTYIEGFGNEYTVIGECASVKEAVIVTNAVLPDIVLLDINLEDGTGFDFLKQLKQINFSIVFITAYEDFALQALKVGAIDYILKPIDETELKDALFKASHAFANTTSQARVANEHLENNKSRIILSLMDSYQVIELKDLMYCQSDAGYTTFFLSDNSSYIASKSIKEYERILPEQQFLRTHQSYIVNINFIAKLDKTRIISLKNGKTIPVSIRKMDSVVEKLNT